MTESVTLAKTDSEMRPIRKKDMQAQTEWWRGATIYQVYPRSFMDSNGDGIGDLPGVTSKLDHIASLGVDAIWLSPFFLSPMADFGYDISDFTQVDPIFGTISDFDALVDKAHELGLKVIIDQIYSHTSDQHKWFEESRVSRDNSKSDWYVWADANPDGTPPNNWQSVFGMGAWQWDARRGQYYLHNFLAEQPDLNLHNPDVQNAVLDVARFWMDRGVDGFRLDALNFGMHDPELRDNPVETIFKRPPTRPFDFQRHTRSMSHPDLPEFIAKIRQVTDSYPDRFTVAEVGGPFPLTEMKAFTEGETHLNSAYAFDFLYADEINADLIRSTQADWPGGPGEGWPSWAFSNHDAPRAVSRWQGDCETDQYSKLIALLLLSLRGNVFIYQGEELGLPQAEVPFEKLQDPEAIVNWPETLGRDGARTPLPWTDKGNDYSGFSTQEPWLPLTEAHSDKAVTLQNETPDSVLNFYRNIIALRQSSEALRQGEIAFLQTDKDLLAFTRKHEGEEKLCLFNLTNRPLLFEQAVGNILASVGDPIKKRVIPAYSGFIAG